MEFNSDGLITSEALAQLLEYERQEGRSAEAHEHNMDVAQIAKLGRRIVDHCLKSVAMNRDLLEQEGALNVDIGRFLKKEGFSIKKLDSHGKQYRRGISEGSQTAQAIENSTEFTGVISDLIVDERGDRVELKTAAFATPKDKVPIELFKKDLAYLERPTYTGDLERYPWEGLDRHERLAEMALFVADKKIAQGNSRLRAIVGKIDSNNFKKGATANGLTYEVHTGSYDPSEVLEVQRSRPMQVKNFIVLLVYPSQQN
jgi:hypothetical protein